MAKNTKITLLIAGLALLALTMTGCSSSSAQILTGSSWPGVLVENETLYVSYGSQIFAIEPGENNADVVWKFPVESDQEITFYAKPAIEGELLVVGDYSGTVWALNTVTGREEWSLNVGDTRFIGGPTINEGVVYIGGSDGVLHAIDLVTGTEDWTFETEKGIWSTPLVDEGVVYTTSLDGHLYAVDASGGNELWQFPEDDDSESSVSASVSEAAIYDGVVYFSSFNNNLYAIDLETKNVLWSYQTENWMWGYPVLDDVTGNLIGTDLDGSIFALNVETGVEVWKEQASGRIVATPQLYDYEGERVVLVTSDIEFGDSNLFILSTDDGSEATPAVSITSEFTTKFIFVQTGVDTRSVPLLAEPAIFEDVIVLAGYQGDYPIFFVDPVTLRTMYSCNPSTGECS